jgi:hypothetical protein
VASSRLTREKQGAQSSRFWMRGHYTFPQLRDLIVLLKEYPEGLRPMELNRIVERRGLLLTQQGGKPSPTTLYHCRRALLKLGILKFRGRNLVIASDEARVARIVDSLTIGTKLSQQERNTFADVVLHNDDCRQVFFNYFMQDDSPYDRVTFMTAGTPVIWRPLSTGKKGRKIVFSGLDGKAIGQIDTEVEIQAVLYGVRYWARDELLLIDEFFREDIGNLMFPIREPGSVSEEVVRHAILSEVSNKDEWTVLDVQNLVFKLGIEYRVSVKRVLDTITHIYRKHPDLVAFIATSQRLATLTTSSLFREDFELRSYLRDDRGRYISHIRLHRDLQEESNE